MGMQFFFNLDGFFFKWAPTIASTRIGMRLCGMFGLHFEASNFICENKNGTNQGSVIFVRDLKSDHFRGHFGFLLPQTVNLLFQLSAFDSFILQHLPQIGNLLVRIIAPQRLAFTLLKGRFLGWRVSSIQQAFNPLVQIHHGSTGIRSLLTMDLQQTYLPINQGIKQPTDPLNNQATNQPTNQSIKRRFIERSIKTANKSINRPIKRPSDSMNNQSIKLSNDQTTP